MSTRHRAYGMPAKHEEIPVNTHRTRLQGWVGETGLRHVIRDDSRSTRTPGWSGQTGVTESSSFREYDFTEGIPDRSEQVLPVSSQTPDKTSEQ